LYSFLGPDSANCFAGVLTAVAVQAQDHAGEHAHHQMTNEQFAELREKVPVVSETSHLHCSNSGI
jgi:hypothetical protein